MIKKAMRIVEQRGWHMDRNFPLVGAIGMVMQTIALVWWVSAWTTTINLNMEAQAKEQAYTRTDVAYLRAEVKDLQKSINEGGTPTAVNASQIQALAIQMRSMQAQIEIIRQLKR